MTDAIPTAGFVNELDRRCEQVALRKAEASGAPGEFDLWIGAYAGVLLWPVGEPLEARFDEALSAGESWFADYLSKAETVRGARVIDGYLLLYLTTVPTDGLRKRIREAELSFKVCRKHVVWPAEADPTQRPRLDAVTVLAVPEGITAASGEARWPVMTPDQTSLWDEIQGVDSGSSHASEGLPS